MKHILLCRLVLVAATLPLLMVNSALAGELFKCRTQDGDILYSDLACEKTGATRLGIVEPPPKRADRNGQPEASSSSAAKTDGRKTESANAKKSPKDPEARRIREEELKGLLEDASSTIEQKSAAQEEITSNASAGVCKLSDEERSARDHAFEDLRGPRQGRAGAKRVLRQILGVCERI
jgi:hypothetical protein